MRWIQLTHRSGRGEGGWKEHNTSTSLPVQHTPTAPLISMLTAVPLCSKKAPHYCNHSSSHPPPRTAHPERRQNRLLDEESTCGKINASVSAQRMWYSGGGRLGKCRPHLVVLLRRSHSRHARRRRQLAHTRRNLPGTTAVSSTTRAHSTRSSQQRRTHNRHGHNQSNQHTHCILNQTCIVKR